MIRLFTTWLLCGLLTLRLLGSDNLDYGILPADCIVDRTGYALGYSEEHEQPVWVMYRLTRDEVTAKGVARTNDFREDTNIVSRSALPIDYASSGYDRGHLAPAEDMKFSSETMHDSFYMSNMSPQKPAFNRGIWKRLENEVRKLAREEESIFVVTGPIFADDAPTIGRQNKISVPVAFYKVIYDETPPTKVTAFIIPNEGSKADIYEYIRPVEDVEELTGLDFNFGNTYILPLKASIKSQIRL